MSDEIGLDVRRCFTAVPQQLYVLSDGFDRQIIITSVACHNIMEENSHVSFNLNISPRNNCFLDTDVYYLHALSGQAVNALDENMKNLKSVVAKGDDMFVWTMTLKTNWSEYILGKALIVARVVDVDRFQNNAGVTAVYQNKKIYKF